MGWVLAAIIAFVLVAGALLIVKAIIRWVTRQVVKEAHKHDR